MAISFPAPEFKLQRSMPQQQLELLQSQQAKPQPQVQVQGECQERKAGKKSQKRKFEASGVEDVAPGAQQLQHDEQKHGGNATNLGNGSASVYGLALCHGHGDNGSPMRTESDEAEREADRRFWEEVTCSHRAKRQKIAASGCRYGIPCVSAGQPCPSGQIFQQVNSGSLPVQGQAQGQKQSGSGAEMDSRGDGTSTGASIEAEASLSDSFEMDSETDDLLGPPWLRQVRVW